MFLGLPGPFRGVPVVSLLLKPDLSSPVPGVETLPTFFCRYLFIFDRPCCGACDLLCYSFTRRPRAFHKARDMQAEHIFESRHLDSAGASRGGDLGPDSNGRAMDTDNTRVTEGGGTQSGNRVGKYGECVLGTQTLLGWTISR